MSRPGPAAGRRGRAVRNARRAAAILLAAIGCAACARDPQVPTCRVETRDFTREILAEGYLEAVDSTPVTAPTEVDSGLHLDWIVADGTPVRSGDVIARFDDSDWIEERDSAAGDRAGVELQLDRHRVGTASDRRRSELDIATARAELEEAERFQAKDEQVFSRNDRIESQLDANLARRREAHAREVAGVQERISSGEGRLIALEGEQADQKLARAERGLAALTARAPSDGLAVLERNWRGNSLQPGDTVWPGQPIAEIPDLTRMRAEIFVLEADAGGLEPGQSATVRLDAHPEQEVDARVERVDKVAKPRRRDLEVQYFGATLSLARTDPATMKPGQRVTARVRVVSLPAALVVPRTALFDRGGGKIVFRRGEKGFEAVAVEVTAVANGLAALAGGVAPGDVLALVDPRAESHRKPAGESAPAAVTGGVGSQ